jgi:hypothetical protein
MPGIPPCPRRDHLACVHVRRQPPAHTEQQPTRHRDHRALTANAPETRPRRERRRRQSRLRRRVRSPRHRASKRPRAPGTPDRPRTTPSAGSSSIPPSLFSEAGAASMSVSTPSRLEPPFRTTTSSNTGIMATATLLHGRPLADNSCSACSVLQSCLYPGLVLERQYALGDATAGAEAGRLRDDHLSRRGQAGRSEAGRGRRALCAERGQPTRPRLDTPLG